MTSRSILPSPRPPEKALRSTNSAILLLALFQLTKQIARHCPENAHGRSKLLVGRSSHRQEHGTVDDEYQTRRVDEVGRRVIGCADEEPQHRNERDKRD